MAEIIVYASFSDAEVLRRWLNAESNVAWIVKTSQQGSLFHWKAQYAIDSIAEGSYALWNTKTGALRIPSGVAGAQGAVIASPFDGWSQTLKPSSDAPWFGGLPGPVLFRWREAGREKTDSLGRSGFHWLANRYAGIGERAHPEALKWWSRLKRFVATHAEAARWPLNSGSSPRRAYLFPGAAAEIKGGRHADTNP
jgi:hypothetical protein